MIVKTSMKIGGVTYQFEFEEKDEKDTLSKAIVLSNPRIKCICGEIGFETKHLTSNKDKEGNVYVNCKCNKCGAKSKLGSYKSGGFFWHDYEIYKPSGTSEEVSDIPFPDSIE